MVRIDRSGAKEFLPEGSLVQQAQSAIDMLKDGTGAGSKGYRFCHREAAVRTEKSAADTVHKP